MKRTDCICCKTSAIFGSNNRWAGNKGCACDGFADSAAAADACWDSAKGFDDAAAAAAATAARLTADGVEAALAPAPCCCASAANIAAASFVLAAIEVESDSDAGVSGNVAPTTFGKPVVLFIVAPVTPCNDDDGANAFPIEAPRSPLPIGNEIPLAEFRLSVDDERFETANCFGVVL